MDPRERWSDNDEALRVAIESAMLNAWTALPGILVSFDADKVTAVVKSAVGGVALGSDGEASPTDLPLLQDVPVVFPRGGGATLTFPLQPGDEVLVVFSCRPIDSWWQSGGVQRPANARFHDLSDAFAIPGPMSQARKIGGISTSAVQLRSDDGAAFVEIDPASHAVNVSTTGDLSLQAGGDISVQAGGSLTMQAGSEIDLTAPVIKLNGAIQLNGPISQGASTGGTTASLIGPVTVTNDVTAAGKSVAGHHHTEHDGPSTSGPV